MRTGTLLRNEQLTLVPRCIIADHGLPAPADDVLRLWVDLYCDAIQRPHFRTLREIQGDILQRVLRHFGVDADATPCIELYFQITTRIELYPKSLTPCARSRPSARRTGPAERAVPACQRPTSRSAT